MEKSAVDAYRKIGVIGAGTMGAGIALTALRAGLSVVLFDISPEALASARAYIEKFLTRKGLQSNLANLKLTSTLEEIGGVQAVIEAALESLDLKIDLFSRLSRICPPPVPLASNTSTLPITRLAAAAEAPGRVGGMHFFNPAPVMQLVEVVRGAQTTEATLMALNRLAEQLGKSPVVTRDTPGFIVNRVARPFYGEALRLLQDQVASPAEIDLIAERAGGFSMGPFKLMDLIGIDINFTSMNSVYEQTFHEPRYQPSLLQLQKIQEQALGRKSGRGFYSYDSQAPVPQPEAPVAAAMHAAIYFSPGTWAPGLRARLQACGCTFADGPGQRVTCAIIASGRDEDLPATLRRVDEHLPAEVPILCQAADATVSEIAGWLRHHERLAGFDGLFSTGSALTLTAAPALRPEVRAKIDGFLGGAGYTPVWVQESPAMVLPRLVAMLANDAAFAVQQGIADAATIDRAMRLGVNYPRGPLEWGRELGLHRILGILDHLWHEYHEERYRAAQYLRRAHREASLAPS